jgi:hypothetical protein
MQRNWIVLGVLVAAGAVAYLLFSTQGTSPGAASPAEGDTGTFDDDAVQTPGEAPSGPVRGGIKPAPVSDKGDARERGGAPKMPEPTVSLEQARRDFAAILAEIDAVKDEGRRLEQAAWIDLYKRGNEALTPLHQHLSWSVPEQADELRKAQDDFRAKLREVEPRPGM